MNQVLLKLYELEEIYKNDKIIKEISKKPEEITQPLKEAKKNIIPKKINLLFLEVIERSRFNPKYFERVTNINKDRYLINYYPFWNKKIIREF